MTCGRRFEHALLFLALAVTAIWEFSGSLSSLLTLVLLFTITVEQAINYVTKFPVQRDILLT